VPEPHKPDLRSFEGSQMGLIAVLVRKTCTLVVAMCAAACFAQAASALDLNTITPPPAKPQQKPDWAGFYFRNNSSGSDPWTVLTPSTGFAAPPTPATSVQPSTENFGYNFQSGNVVFGLEGSFAAANFDGKFTAPYLPATTAGGWTPNMNWLGTVTGRVGYSVGQWLPYVKGGFAAADVGSPLQGAGQIGSFTQGTTATGWTAGLGFEYQFSPKWSLGLEYLYTDLGGGAPNGAPGSLGGGAISGSPEMYSTALKSQSLLGRLNYKAGW
jgi:outer membrane immunogenic protein